MDLRERYIQRIKDYRISHKNFCEIYKIDRNKLKNWLSGVNILECEKAMNKFFDLDIDMKSFSKKRILETLRIYNRKADLINFYDEKYKLGTFTHENFANEYELRIDVFNHWRNKKTYLNIKCQEAMEIFQLGDTLYYPTSSFIIDKRVLIYQYKQLIRENNIPDDLFFTYFIIHGLKFQYWLENEHYHSVSIDTYIKRFLFYPSLYTEREIKPDLIVTISKNFHIDTIIFMDDISYMECAHSLMNIESFKGKIIYVVFASPILYSQLNNMERYDEIVLFYKCSMYEKHLLRYMKIACNWLKGSIEYNSFKKSIISVVEHMGIEIISHSKNEYNLYGNTLIETIKNVLN